MSGFKNIDLNKRIQKNVLKLIIDKILICCDKMSEDLLSKNEKLKNLEEDIRDYLFNNYLNNDEIMEEIEMNNFRFFSEVPVKYVDNKPKGRIDLQVFNKDDISNRKKYFTIECKRIDGKSTLNRYYIENGIIRFVKRDPLYESFFKQECMLAFVVKNIDIENNANIIDDLQLEYDEIHVKDHFSKIEISEGHDYIYDSTYEIEDDSDLSIYHVFYDFSSIIEVKN